MRKTKQIRSLLAIRSSGIKSNDKMITTRRLSNAVVFMVLVDRYLLTAAAADCCGCLDALLGPNDRCKVVLSNSILSGEYKRIDESLMSEAYAVIDRHLRRLIDTSDFNTNIEELRVLIHRELEAKSTKSDSRNWWNRWRADQCLSQQLPSKNRDVMVNALMRLLQLEHIDQVAHRCTFLVTQELAENNRIAQDTIGRRIRNDPFLFPRIDNIIFDAALRRADICIPYYRDRLKAVSQSADAFAMVHRYWSRILEHRFDAAHFGVKHGKVDQIFKQHPEGALNLVEKMPFAIEEDEIDIAQEFLDSESRRRSFGTRWDDTELRTLQYEVYLETPCTDLISLVMHTFDSFDFDMQLQQYIFSGLMEATQTDGEISRMKAYYLMCRKLMNQRNRFIAIISNHAEDVEW